MLIGDSTTTPASLQRIVQLRYMAIGELVFQFQGQGCATSVDGKETGFVLRHNDCITKWHQHNDRNIGKT